MSFQSFLGKMNFKHDKLIEKIVVFKHVALNSGFVKQTFKK